MIEVLIRPSFEALVETSTVERVVDTVLRAEAVPMGASLSVVITGDDEIRALNSQFRGIDAPTDVLSFADGAPDSSFINAPDEPPYLGDVIVSFPRAQAQAAERGYAVTQEMHLLIVHGVLHLLGYDHATPDTEADMWDRQEAILALASIDYG